MSKETLNEKEYLILLDALAEYMRILDETGHPVVHRRVFTVYQKVGQALGAKTVDVVWEEADLEEK